MWVADLQCEHGHLFEGWFASSEALAEQQASGLVSCPLCASRAVQRRLSAPRLNVAHLKAERLGQANAGAPGADATHPASQGAAASHAGQAERGSLGVAELGAPVAQPPSATLHAAPSAPISAEQLQAAYLRLVREVIAHTEDVGGDFAQEARRIHHGQAPARGIRGQSSAAQQEELLEEGIAVLSLPIPKGWDGPLQ